MGSDGAAEDQLYSQRAECGLWGEEVGGMSFHCRDGCSIPKSSGHEEETDGFDAVEPFHGEPLAIVREPNELESSLM